jgi:hypothetical protein
MNGGDKVVPRSREEIIRLVLRAGEAAVHDHKIRMDPTIFHPGTKGYDAVNAANLANQSLNAEGTAIYARFSFELLLDIRDLMAECVAKL